MEKFSAYRDPGTGIQPFLTPVPASADGLTTLLLPLRYAIGVVRTTLVLVLLALYILLVNGLCICLAPLPFLYRFVRHALIAILGRATLFLLGFLWISEEYVSRKRRRDNNSSELVWNPRAGDIIISNWISWPELIWLAVRFNPIFVVPIPEYDAPSAAPRSSTPIDSSRPKRTITKHTLEPLQKQRIPIIGFRQLSLLSIISLAGRTPSHQNTHSSLEDVRKKADRPIVIFPECTTSNGRALLRFSNVFHQKIPVKGYQVFLLCTRYDSPTTVAPSVAHCIPSPFLNPLPHLFRLATALKPFKLQVRLLASSESPSSSMFLASEVISDVVEDELSEASAALISQLGKLKRTNLGWEDKAAFLQFYHLKSK